MPGRSRKPTGRSRSVPWRRRVAAPRRVRRRAADPAGALADVESGLALAPGDSRLQTLRGRLMIEEGRPADGLASS